MKYLMLKFVISGKVGIRQRFLTFQNNGENLDLSVSHDESRFSKEVLDEKTYLKAKLLKTDLHIQGPFEEGKPGLVVEQIW